jgi:hypothetical protein
MSQTIGYIINESNIPGFTETNIIAQNSKGKVTAEAILQVADEVNRNGRMYPYNELIPQLTAPRTLELLESGYLRGECGHPISNDLTRQQTIDDKLTCTQYLKIWHEGNIVKCTYRPTNNAYGKALNEDLLEGCKPSFSLRALGTVEKENGVSVVKNLKVVTWDADVVYPSHPSAYTQRIVSESANIQENSQPEIKLPHLQNLYESYLEENKDTIMTESSMLIPITNNAVVDLLKHQSNNIKSLKEMFDFAYTDMYLNDEGTQATLVSKDGTKAVIGLENYVSREIEDYCVQQKAIRDNNI